MMKRLAVVLLLGGVGWYMVGPRPAMASSDAPSGAASDGGAMTGGLWGSGIPWAPEYIPESQPAGEADSGGVLDWLQESGVATTEPRGIRNHNPGNIEYTGTQWRGLADPPSDGRYAVFVAPRYGIRAMARVLDTYATDYGLNTVAGIISRWAPAHENPTSAYAQFVADALGVGVEQPINVMAKRAGLIAAMIEFENGQQPYSMALIKRGVKMA